jgi:hypothetical protein
MLRSVLEHIPENAISNLNLRWSYKALCNNLVLLSPRTLGNICRRDYALTVDVIKKQLPRQNKISLTLDGWTSTKTRAMMSVIAYCMNRNWVLSEVQLTFDEVECLFGSCFDSELRMSRQGATYWSKINYKFKERA